MKTGQMNKTRLPTSKIAISSNIHKCKWQKKSIFPDKNRSNKLTINNFDGIQKRG